LELKIKTSFKLQESYSVFIQPIGWMEKFISNGLNSLRLF